MARSTIPYRPELLDVIEWTHLELAALYGGWRNGFTIKQRRLIRHADKKNIDVMVRIQRLRTSHRQRRRP